MRIKKITGLILFSIHYSLFAFSQSDSCSLRISLLTCSPGKELYAAWGHTAIRVIDSTNNIDIVFNYGTFDDSDPSFLAKFTRGIMDYALSAYPFSDFVEEYKSAERGVWEQTLSISCDDKEKLYNALRINAQNENRFYKYYFSADNCTTRAKDMIIKNNSRPISFKTIIPSPAPSFRNLIHIYLDKGNQLWSKLGIDILLGSNLDKKATNDQAMFLPDYLMKGFDNARINNRPLVSETNTIIDIPHQTEKNNSSRTPLLFFSIGAFLILILSLLPYEIAKKILTVFDTVFFLLLGVLGIVLVILWIIRIDDVCRSNFNLLWAVPTHAPVAFVLLKNKNWVRFYFKLIILLTALTAAAWWLIPQQFNMAIVPLLVVILIRSWQRCK